ncbi:MspA family porin [Nocardia farcinica]|uniref:MspA family porin n=1 Tax=Nocardia farcinica TaxID=37329 RepID=UPI001484D43E|nr:MspA family porin [Nocardia farcinica]MBF6363891.1 MspA family porin [Nocardia farcinica]
MSVSKTGESVERRPGLSQSPVSRAGVVTFKAAAVISGAGSRPVGSGSIRVGYQVGCAIDVFSGITLGLTTSGPTVGLTVAPVPGVTLGGQATVTPSISTTLVPGTVSTVMFGNKPLIGQDGSISFDQSEVNVDACVGPVTIRSFATATLSTRTADHSVIVYGDPVQL